MAEILETIRGALTKGLRSDDRDVRSGDNSAVMTALEPTPYGARVHETVTVPISAGQLSTHSVTIAHPFPQLFIGKAVTLLVTDTKVFTVNMANWTLTAVTLYNPASTGSTATISAGGGPWHFMDFGTTWMLFNGASVVFKSGHIVSTKTFVDEAITATTGCAFRGQGFLGGFNSVNYWPNAWVNYWNSIPHSTAADSDWNLVPPSPGANWVSWSSIGGGDLLMNRMTPATFNTSLSDQIIANGNFLNGGTYWTLSGGGGGDWVLASGKATHTRPVAVGIDTMTQSNAAMLTALGTGDYWVEFDTDFTTANGDGFRVGLGATTSASFTTSGHYRTKLTVASGADLVFTPQQTTSTDQLARPDVDVANSGSWTFSAGSSFYSILDNGTTSGGAYCRSPSGNDVSTTLRVVDIEPAAGLTALKIELHASTLAGSGSIRITTYNGSDLTTALETITVTTHGVGGSERDYVFSATTWNAITDWANFTVKIHSLAQAGEQIELHYFDVIYSTAKGDSFTIDNITVTEDLAEEESMALHYARRNEAGAMPMDFQGTVLKVFPMRDLVMVYGVDGISALRPYSQPFPTYGLQEGVHRMGIASRDAVGGHLDEHVFVDTSGVLYSVDGQAKVTRLGFEEFMAPLLGEQFTIAYDPNRRGYYIGGDTGSNVECYYLTDEKNLSKHHQLVSSIYQRDAGLIGIAENDASPTTLAWSSNIVDLGFDEIKHISWIEISYTNITALTVNVSYRYAKADAFTELGARVGSPDGRFFIGVSGVEFKIVLAGTTAAGAEIERIDVRYDTYDNRTARSPRRKSAYFS